MPEVKWVFDTVSLSNFIFSDAAFILEKRYAGRACITLEVFNAISTGIPVYPKLKLIDTLIDNAVFEVVSLSKPEHLMFRELVGNLGKGEASCIALAQTRSLIVVTDDRAARKACARKSIPVTGTIGILKAAVGDGQVRLSLVNEIHEKMVENGFYSPIKNLWDIV